MATFVEELIARLALETDEASFEEGNQSLAEMAKNVFYLSEAWEVFGRIKDSVISTLVTDFVDQAKAVSNLSRVAGEGFEAFQLYAAGAKTVGVEQDKLADIFKDTNDKIGDFLQTGAGPMADFFEKIGPKVGITADMFRDLSGKDALQLYVDGLEKANLSQSEMTFYMEAIASDATMLLPLLKNGGAGFSAMAEEALAAGAVITESGRKSANDFGDSWQMLTLWITGVKNSVAQELLPTLTEMISTIRGFIKDNKELIASSLAAFFKLAAVALKGLAVAGALFLALKLGQTVLATAYAVTFLTKAFTAGRLAALLFNAAVLAIPILIGLAVAAVALLAEDLYTFFQGGESYIGDFVKQWPLLGEAINGVGDALQFAWKYAQDMFDLLYAIVTLDFSGLADAMGRVVDKWKTVLSAFFDWVWDNTPDILKDALSATGGAISSAADTVKGAASAAKDFVTSPFAEGGIFGGPAPMIAPAVASQAVSNSSSRTMQDNRQYNITGTDIGEVKRVLNEKNAFAAKTIDTGVEY